MSRRSLLTEINNLPHFAEILRNNPGLIVIKFGATWCAPCKRIEKQVYQWIDKLPQNVQSIIIDVDVSFEVYSFLKNKKMINGIPAILCYYKGNLNYIPDDSVIGADPNAVDLFFTRCLQQANLQGQP